MFFVAWLDWSGREWAGGPRFNLRETAERFLAVVLLHVHRVKDAWIEVA